MIRIAQLKVSLDDMRKPPEALAARFLRIPVQDIQCVRLIRRSVDARDKKSIFFSLTLDVETRRNPGHLPAGAEYTEPEETGINIPRIGRRPLRPVVVGMGPAGLFAALYLARAGLEPLVLERGRRVETRARDVEEFWKTGRLDPDSNVQFGEGGAGTFSDGKLNSGIKDPRSRSVLRIFHEMGAPEEILYESKPHIGTDRLRDVVRNLREEILRLGGEIRYETRLDAIHVERGAVRGVTAGGAEIETDSVILAIGHSARDTFEMLLDAGVVMEQKPFSIGARIEHSQKKINLAQWGPAAGHPALGAADYKLSCHLPDGRAAYTFCMCPGGQVVAAASEEGGVVVNGMSLYARDGENANSALLVSVGPEDYGGSDPLAGVRFQRKWERAAFALGGRNYRAPAQTVGDFLNDRASTQGGDVRPAYRPGVTWTNLSECLPEYVIRDMKAAIGQFDRKIHGFAHPGAVLTGVETRSSSPVRLLRGEDFRAIGIRGLYPAGEGAGYAGGILSAAVDGLRCAEALGRALKEE